MIKFILGFLAIFILYWVVWYLNAKEDQDLVETYGKMLKKESEDK